jgi:hypothetical protein
MRARIERNTHRDAHRQGMIEPAAVLGDWLFDGKVPAALSLAVTAVVLAAGILFSLWKTRAGGILPLGDGRA